MVNYFLAKFGAYGKEVIPRKPKDILNRTVRVYSKEKEGDIEVLTSFVNKKPFRRVSILETDIDAPIKRRAVLVEDLKTGNKTQINTSTYLNTINHKETFPDGRLQFSVSKVTIDKNGNRLEGKMDAYHKSQDGKSWVHYISNDNPFIYDWKSWQ